MCEMFPFFEIDCLDYKVYTNDEIDKISVMKVTTEESLNRLGHFNEGGLYDTRMGKLCFSFFYKNFWCIRNGSTYLKLSIFLSFMH